MTNKNILLISPESWGNHFVSKHHYALELAKRGNKVFFLNVPSKKFRTLEINKNLNVVDYKPLFRGVGKLPRFVSSFLTKIELGKLEKLLSCSLDIVWNFDSSRFFNLASINGKLKICHIVDMAENMHRDLLARTSSVCFCTSDFIKAELLKSNKKTFKIHHGYQLPQEQEETLETFPQDRLQVGIVGNLTRECIDWETILSLIKENDQIDFNFIGSYTVSNLSKISLKKSVLHILLSSRNVRLLGGKDSSKLPSYLEKFDVQLCAYSTKTPEQVAQHSNLHKIMEYLGSGSVVVTSYVDEYKDEKELVVMVEPGGDFARKFNEVITSINYFNSSELKRRRKEYALSHAYAAQTDKISNILAQHG